MDDTKKPAPHNTGETLACLIIDDPLLKPTYGCLDYRKLLGEMKAHNFFTEIAFIPYNYRRSDPETVRLFADNADRLGICVHGCNHTSNEFGGGDYRRLRELAESALWRMEEHKKNTGLPYDPIMVFPQGKFSSTAMKALRDAGYLAAFNSKITATDRQTLPDNEYQQPATKIYHDFPLFLRRYPEDRADFARDVQWGRPIVVVEHHAAFKNGFRAMTDLVDWINTLGNIRWTSLLNIAEYYLGEKAPDIRPKTRPSPERLRARLKIAVRRRLSEARDNYIETNDLMTRIYRLIRG